MHLTDYYAKRLKSIWKGDCIIAGSKTYSTGVAILLKKDFEYQIIDSFTDTIGNPITQDINITNIKLKVIMSKALILTPLHFTLKSMILLNLANKTTL